MKKADLRMLVAEHDRLTRMPARKKDVRMLERLKEIERIYFHETGRHISENAQDE